jgi:hypothetical protein
MGRLADSLGSLLNFSTYPQALNFSALPAASDHAGEIYVVLEPEGVWLINRKRAGLYYSDGSTWRRLGDIIEAFNDANFEIFNNSDATKKIEFDASAISTGTSRTIHMPDKDIYLINDADVLHNNRSDLQGGTTDEYYHLTQSEHTDTLFHIEQNHENFFNGTFKETFDATVVSAGGVITMSLEQSGGGDLSMIFSDGVTTLDTTPAATIALTGGTATVPQDNYIYIPQSTKVLTKSTTDWPSAEHIKVAFFTCLDAATTQSNSGPLVNQNWNEHGEDTNSQGHLTHIGDKIRKLAATYHSGALASITINTNVGTPDNVDLDITSGIIYQMHRHTYPSMDTSSGGDVHIPNDSVTPYDTITDLNTLLTDSTGSSMSGRHFTLVVWGACNKSGEHSPTFINLPSGSYVLESDAILDVNNYNDFTIPDSFLLESSTGFLITAFTFKHSVASGGTWTLVHTADLRGITPAIATATIGGGDNFTVKCSADDSTAGYLEDKIVVSDGANSTNILELSTLNDGADEDVQIQIDESKIDHTNIIAGDGSDHSDVVSNTTHRGSDGKDHSDVVLNNTHRTGDGSDHADVATNTTHSTGDGSDHADVATNTTHSTGDGSDHADVASNTTHRSSDGSDHTFIDQDVTSTGTPSFNQVTVDNIDINGNTITGTGGITTSGEVTSGDTIGFPAQSSTGDGTTTIDWRLGNKYNFTFGAQADTFTFTAPTNPCGLTLTLKQDGVGGRDATWPGAVTWLGAEPTWTDGGASKTILVAFYYDGTTYWGQGTPWEV